MKRLAPCLEARDPSDCDDPGRALETYYARLAVIDQRLATLQRNRDNLSHAISALRPSPEQASRARA